MLNSGKGITHRYNTGRCPGPYDDKVVGGKGKLLNLLRDKDKGKDKGKDKVIVVVITSCCSASEVARTDFDAGEWCGICEVL